MEIIDWVNLNVKQGNPWENMEIKQEIGEELDEKQYLLQMIWEIEDDGVKKVLLSYNSNELYSSTKIKEGLKVYSDAVANFSSEKLAELNGIISKYNMLPSAWVRQLEIKDVILAESDPEVKKLMEISLKSNIRPSVIMEEKAEYQKIATIGDKELKDFTLYRLQEWVLPKLVEEEYENYKDIKNYDYKDENLKEFLLSLIKDEKISPSLIELYFDIIKDKEFWEETEKFIRGLINQPKK